MPSRLPHHAVAIVFLSTLAIPLCAAALPKIKLKKAPTETTADSYNDYLKRVRAMSAPEPTSVGSLWVSSTSLAALSQDFKARNPGDLIIIHLVDNFSAATAGENSQSRKFNANSAITGLVGTIGARNRLQNLFNANSAMGLDDKGQSTLSSNVSLNLAAQVMEVLPNGVLVVQAARDITVGNDRQTVLIRGLVRTGDLAPDDSILSTSVSDLEVEIKGKGAVADATRQPNIVIRILLRLLNF
jgi:flagellar L-ring protein precursor FlgH